MRSLIIFLVLIGMSTTSYSQKDLLIEAFKNNHSEKVISIGDEILKNNPNDVDALLLTGRAYNDKKQYKKAIPYLIKASENAKQDWQFSWCYTELVYSYYLIGNKEKSLEFYNKTNLFKGTKTTLRKLKWFDFFFGFDAFYNDWETIETDHIIFRFQDASAIKNIDFYIKKRVKAFATINTFFNSKLPKKIDFFVWKNQKEAQKVLGSNTVLGFTNPMFCMSHNRPNQTVGHEIAHNISYWIDDPVKKTRFINEGIGVYFDQSNTNRILKAKDVLNKQSLDIVDMWKNGRNYSEKFLYAISGAFVEQLILHNKGKFLELCANQTYENAQIIYGSELNKIIHNFNNQINN